MPGQRREGEHGGRVCVSGCADRVSASFYAPAPGTGGRPGKMRVPASNMPDTVAGPGTGQPPTTKSKVG